MISVHFQDKSFNITVIQVCAQPLMPKKLKLNGSMKTYISYRTNTPKRCYFHYRGLGCKSRKQETPAVTDKFGLGVQNQAEQRLTMFYQENVLITENIVFQKHERKLYTWTSPDDQYQKQIDYILCSQRSRSSIE